ncbi:MAG: hypothetical protein JWN34_5170 [Bryobacterales bacterium]|jgi:hypothetical protein|nr:hypothetical protein [Bryobacterales bacterium]
MYPVHNAGGSTDSCLAPDIIKPLRNSQAILHIVPYCTPGAVSRVIDKLEAKNWIAVTPKGQRSSRL